MKSLKLSHLETEQNNPNSKNIDVLSTQELLTLINSEDKTVSEVVQKEIPEISKIIDAIYEKLKKGGRLFYIGSGTSGRLGVLDAAECPPTFGVSAELVQGIIAGGNKAIISAQEGIEDKINIGKEDLLARNFSNKDFLVGIAASGRTPYVIGALDYANEIGAETGSISCVNNAVISKLVSYPIEVVTGPEVITGSTRMKAGTAQKLTLNMISTAVMIKLGKVYKNYMVDVSPSNLKLENRAINMIQSITGVGIERAQELYLQSDKHVKTAIVMELGKVSFKEANNLLKIGEGHVSKALSQIYAE